MINNNSYSSISLEVNKAHISFRTIFIILLSVCLFTRLILILKPVLSLDGKLLLDDTYLSLEIARNIAQGKGPLYGDEFTNGFQPLYVFLMVPFYYFSADQIEFPIRMSLLLLTIFDLATLAVILRWTKALSNNPYIVLLAGIMWIINDYVVRTSLNGLETVIATFFIVTSSFYFYRMYYVLTERKSQNFFILGILVGFACFTRVDSIILAMIIGLLILIREYKNLGAMFTRASIYSAGALAIFSFWMVYSTYYTGGWYPESGKAVRFMSLANTDHTLDLNWILMMLRFAFLVEVKENTGLIVCALALLPLLVWVKKRKSVDHLVQELKKISPLLFFGVTIFFAYTLYIFTYWYFERYFFPFIPLLILIIVLLLNGISLELSRRAELTLYTCFFILWIGLAIGKGKLSDYYFGKPSNSLGYANLGLWAQKNIPTGSVVGCLQSGALQYFNPGLRVVNLDGVVSGACFEALVKREHIEYIKRSKVDYIVGWDINLEFIKQHSKNYKPSDVQLVEKIDGFMSWNRPWYLYKVNYGE